MNRERCISALMDRIGPVCRPGDDLRNVVRRLASCGRDALPVCDEARKFLGTLTSRQICLHASATGRPLGELQAGEVVSAPRWSLRPWQTDREALALMARERLWQVPVLDRTGHLLGEVCFERLQSLASGEWGRIRLVDGLEELRAVTRGNLPAVWIYVLGLRKLVSPAGQQVQLSRGEGKLLRVLVEHCGRTASREVLMRGVCNRAYVPGDRYVDVLVSNLRRKFADLDPETQVVRTIHNDGYAFELTVAEPWAGASADEPVVAPAAEAVG